MATFLTIRRRGGFARAAREMNIATSQASKAVTRLEAQIGLKLLTRSPRGATLTRDAERLVPALEGMVAHWRSIERPEPEVPALTLAIPSYLEEACLPAILGALPGSRVRILQLSSPAVRAQANDRLFEMAIAPALGHLPASWEWAPCGALRKGLFANPVLARQLGPHPLKPADVQSVPFICPIRVVERQIMPVDDGCPLPLEQRRVGHEVASFGVALALAQNVPQLTFGPVVAARRYLSQGSLVEIPVEGWSAHDPLVLACDRDRVLARVQRSVLGALRTALGDG